MEQCGQGVNGNEGDEERLADLVDITPNAAVT